ncbi:condensation domain-containing protein [Nocardia carnea]|uniref:condensation domain-containing protein n=1 Tax=Nocardia carnea TaxID=37328 RepID=UPI00245553EA|nr:condensation domain-containing protein [Nocardia carnea]
MTNLLTDARLEVLRRRLAVAGAGAGPAASPATAETVSTGGLAVAERRMWKIYQLDPDSISHNIGLILDFTGSHTIGSVIAAFEVMVRNAAVLSSVIVTGAAGDPRREAIEHTGRWAEPGAVWEWGTLPPHAALTATGTPIGREQIRAAAEALAQAPFDLTREPPLRARIFADADGAVTVALVVHHLAVDDTSWPLLLGTLVSGSWPAVTGRPARPATVASPDEIDRALRHAQDTWAAADVRYPLSGELPGDSAEQSWLAPLVDAAGIRLGTPIEPAGIEALDGVAREAGATLNALLIGVCAVSVYALTGAADHVLLVPADNRDPDDGPDRVGYSGNIVPMRFRFDPAASVRDSLRAAVSVVYRAMEFATVDYGTVLTALRTAGGRFPVAEIMASVRNAPLRGIPVPDRGPVNYESVFHGVGNYPLTLAFERGADERVHLEVDYQPDAVGPDLARSAGVVVSAIVAAIPHALDRPLNELVRTVRETTAATT